MSHAKTDGIPDGWVAENGMRVIQPTTDDPAFRAYLELDEIILELFAGPGGMSEGMRMAGLDTMTALGFEWDASACMTATSAGHPRVHADLTTIAPCTFTRRVKGIHGSPPCQGFSPAGKGEGRHDMLLLTQACEAMGRGMAPDDVMAILRQHVRDAKSPLALEPLRWALDLRPEWVTMEQVATVQPLWDVVAKALRERGYHVWTGVVQSEQYGVPQTRKRAVLIASLVHDVSGGMVPTHSKFYTHKSKRGQLDEGVLPYVTMEQALGWGMTERPSMTVTGGGTNTGGAEPFGNGARKGMAAEAAAGRWHQRSNYNSHEPATDAAERARAIRELDEPSSTITSKGFTWASDELRGRGTLRRPTHMGDVRNSHGCVRAMDEPSPTLTSSADNGNFQFVNRAADVKASGRRVTVQEAGILQSFPATYSWVGTQTKQYEQVGNAVPPLLGKAMIETVIGIRETKRKAA